MISFRRFFAIFNARNKEFYRDWGALGWTLLFPIVMIFSFSYLFEISNQNTYKLAYVGGKAPKILQTRSLAFQSIDEALDKLQHHKIDLVVQKEETDVGRIYKYWVNEASPTSQILEKLWLADGVSSVDQVIRENMRIEPIGYVDWLLPGLLAMNVMMMTMWGVGWVIVRQRKLGILKRLKVSPLNAVEYLLAQMVSRQWILLLSGVFVFGFAHMIYPFSNQGSLWEIAVIYVLGGLSMSAFGLIIAARMQSDELASGLLNFITMPMMMLSEVWFSLEGSPEWVLTLAQSLPLWHMADGMRKIMLEGAHLSDLSTSLLYLLVSGFFFTALGSWMFRWNIDGE
ncbi:MAG: ABC transporter permease [Oligoflexales bacterium]